MLKVATIVFLAVSFVVFGDAAGKILTGDGVSPLTVAWLRFLFGAIIIFPISGIRLKELNGFKDWRVIVRGLFITAGIGSILTALKTEPIANVFGAFFIGPIVSYLIAVCFLGERSTYLRFMLLALGFIGVLLVVKPGAGASVGMGFALFAGVCYGCYLATTKLVADKYRPRFLLMSQLLIGTCVLTPVGVSAGLPKLNMSVFLLLLVSACGSAIGNYLLVVSNRVANASLIAPLIYSQLISATAVGVLLFDDWPDAYSLLGLVLIIVSGFGSIVFVMRAR